MIDQQKQEKQLRQPGEWEAESKQSKAKERERLEANNLFNRDKYHCWLSGPEKINPI
jgi:hypothetical protein